MATRTNHPAKVEVIAEMNHMVVLDKNYSGNQRLTRFLLGCGAVGPLLFIVVFLIEGPTRPHYSPWHNFVSDLSIGPQGWQQITNFVVCGTLMLCFAVGRDVQ